MDLDVIILLIQKIISLEIFRYFVISFAVLCCFLLVRNLVRGDF